MTDPKLESEADFILLKRFGFSMKRLLERYPDGCPDEVTAQALGCTVEEVQERYQNVVLELRRRLQVDV
jgi:hypothetical protein